MGIFPVALVLFLILSLIEVTWADGEMDEHERAAVLAGVAAFKGSLDHALIGSWLEQRPSAELMEAWTHYMMRLKETMDPKELKHLRDELLGRARKIALSAGKLFGLIPRVSSVERAVLK